jgi:hypothetical protein
MTRLKKCTKCKKEKPATTEFFYKCKKVKSGLSGSCKVCCAEKQRKFQQSEKGKEWRKKYDKSEIAKETYSRYSKSKKGRDRAKKFYDSEKGQEYHKNYRSREDLKSVRAKYTRDWRNNNPSAKIADNLRRRLNKSIERGQMNKKSDSTMSLVGCSPKMLIDHLESLFTEGMSWDNYGIDGWHIDHILPCASFDLNDPLQQIKCFHYTNLQPLWALDNIKKSDKIIY